MLVKKRFDDLDKSGLKSDIHEYNETPQKFLERAFGKDIEDFKPQELDSYEKIVMNYIKDRINKKRLAKRFLMAEDLYYRCKSFDTDILELLIFETVIEFISYKKKTKTELRK